VKRKLTLEEQAIASLVFGQTISDWDQIDSMTQRLPSKVLTQTLYDSGQTVDIDVGVDSRDIAARVPDQPSNVVRRNALID
jgi:hypothetical protein